MKDTRIPRPTGTTNLARTNLNQALEDRMIDSYLIGTFPFGGQNLDLYTFSSLYNIPLKKLKARIQSQLADSLEEDGMDLRQVLEDRRLKMLGGVVGRIGRSDFEIQRVLRFLGGLVLQSRSPDPNLIKEINSAIGNQIRLTEAELKAIGTLDSHLNLIPIEPESVEKALTNEQILERLASIKADPKLLAEYIDGTPELDPIETGSIRVQERNLNRLASHDYEKPDVERIPLIEDIPHFPM